MDFSWLSFKRGVTFDLQLEQIDNQMRHIWDFLRSVYCSFWLDSMGKNEQKTELSHLIINLAQLEGELDILEYKCCLWFTCRDSFSSFLITSINGRTTGFSLSGKASRATTAMAKLHRTLVNKEI